MTQSGQKYCTTLTEFGIPMKLVTSVFIVQIHVLSWQQQAFRFSSWA